jgi:hypothetical protein
MFSHQGLVHELLQIHLADVLERCLEILDHSLLHRLLMNFRRWRAAMCPQVTLGIQLLIKVSVSLWVHHVFC